MSHMVLQLDIAQLLQQVIGSKCVCVVSASTGVYSKAHHLSQTLHAETVKLSGLSQNLLKMACCVRAGGVGLLLTIVTRCPSAASKCPSIISSMLTMHPIPGPDSKLIAQLLQMHAVKHLSTLLHPKLCPEDEAESVRKGKSMSLSTAA